MNRRIYPHEACKLRNGRNVAALQSVPLSLFLSLFKQLSQNPRRRGDAYSEFCRKRTCCEYLSEYSSRNSIRQTVPNTLSLIKRGLRLEIFLTQVTIFIYINVK